MDITKDTKVSEILKEYGDIAAVMETFGIKRVAGYDIRKFITKALTVEWAARVHRVPLDEFLTTLRTAVGQNSEQ
jgi:virulence-associated protein VapD